MSQPWSWRWQMKHVGKRGNVRLATFIASVSSSKSLASFTNRTFHFSKQSSFKMVFDAERNGRFGRIQCQRGKESSSRGKGRRQVFLCRRTVRVKVGGKAISASFLKIEGWETLVGAKDRGKRQIEELICDQNPGPKAPPRSKRG